MKIKHDAGHKALAPVEGVKALTETGEFEGYASVFGEVDHGGDVVLAGAFRDSLAARPADRIKMFYMHESDKPIGKWLEIREDGRGLYVKGKILTTIEKGREVYEMLREGILDGLSIGYRTLDDEFDRAQGVRRLKTVDLREISLVTFPMLESATVSLVKARASEIDSIDTLSDAEKLLREAAEFSRKDARDFVSRVKRIAQREAEADDDLKRLLADIRAANKSLNPL